MALKLSLVAEKSHFLSATVLPREHRVRPLFSLREGDSEDDCSATTANFDTRLGRRDAL
jgi:hypothetical protein